MSLFRRGSSSSQSGSAIPFRKSEADGPPGFARHLGMGLTLLLALMAADLGIIAIRDRMLPSGAPVPARPPSPPPIKPGRFEYDVVTQRNVFNSDGKIPPALGQTEETAPQDGEPVPSQLPLNLVGTIVHVNPARGVATIEIKTSNKILSFVPNDAIESLATLVRVERKKAIFRNLGSGRLEYIEIKDEAGLKIGMAKKGAGPSIDQQGSTFTLKRSDLNKVLDNLPEVLQQARAVPNIVPGSGGRIDGFKILDIMPGSIYEKIGIQRMDIIKEVNGQPVDSPARAMELYNELKNSPQLSLTLERGGRLETNNYRVE